jgi:hypothetical protein
MTQFKKIEPLSNFQIIEKCIELKIKNFKGVFMRNELNKASRQAYGTGGPTFASLSAAGTPSAASPVNECMVINTDHSLNEGTHWTSLFIRNGTSFYFDSFGFPPSLEVQQYCKKPRYYNTFPIQRFNEVICGHLSIYLLCRMSNGANFYEVCYEMYHR